MQLLKIFLELVYILAGLFATTIFAAIMASTMVAIWIVEWLFLKLTKWSKP